MTSRICLWVGLFLPFSTKIRVMFAANSSSGILPGSGAGAEPGSGSGFEAVAVSVRGWADDHDGSGCVVVEAFLVSSVVVIVVSMAPDRNTPDGVKSCFTPNCEQDVVVVDLSLPVTFGSEKDDDGSLFP